MVAGHLARDWYLSNAKVHGALGEDGHASVNGKAGCCEVYAN